MSSTLSEMLLGSPVIHVCPKVHFLPVPAPGAPRRYLLAPTGFLKRHGALRSDLSPESARSRRVALSFPQTGRPSLKAYFSARAMLWPCVRTAAPGRPRSGPRPAFPCRKPANPHPIARIPGSTLPPTSLLPYRQCRGISFAPPQVLLVPRCRIVVHSLLNSTPSLNFLSAGFSVA